MRLLEIKDREEYLRLQIERSRLKFSYCKVAIEDTLSYAAILREYFAKPKMPIGPIACMGSRNGREIDLFRISLYAPDYWIRVIKKLEARSPYPHSFFPPAEAWPMRSDYRHIGPSSVIGVEINPQAKRQDCLIGSFDELPEEWSARFSVLFSNSIDHAMDPARTVSEWLRIIKPGGLLIILWEEKSATLTDPFAELSETDLCALFQCPKLRNASLSYCGYRELYLVKD
jgi:SAM-dependent methyltransferase